MTHLALLCVRNEGAFLLEWLAHHRACGFGNFLIYSNDCTDGTDLMLDRLQDMGWLTHHRNDGPYDQRGIQFTALKAAAKAPTLQQAEWILPLDIDEFVNIHTGDHTLSALHSALPDATAITLTWRLFGNAGIVAFEDAPVTKTFTRCAPAVMHWPWRAAMFKTLYANDGTYRKPGVHRPRDPDKTRLQTAQWYDSSGRALPERFRTKGIFSPFGRNNHRLAQINHYPLGAMESYLLKVDRGRAVHGADRLGMDYWVERNFNSEEDRSITALDAVRQDIQNALLADPVLARLHQAAVAWRRTRLNDLLAQEPYRALLGRLQMTPASRPLTRSEAAVLLRHGQRAHENGSE